jgi:SAM-dependent methyltransferase
MPTSIACGAPPGGARAEGERRPYAMADATPESPLLSRVRREVHPRCEMYAFAVGSLGEEEGRRYYFRSAEFLVEHLLRELERRGRTPGRLALLDFAAGYGRFTRFLAPLFGRVTVADVDPEMIAFDRQTFGVEGFLSDLDPGALTPTPDYDVVFVFSLFTHLPEPLWHVWLRTLWSFVRPGGILVFSARTPELVGRLVEGALSGTQQSAFEHPGRALIEHVLHVYGVRVSLQGAEQVGTLRGTLRIGLTLRASESPQAGPVRLGEAYPRFGLSIEGPRVLLEPESGSWKVTIELPFLAERRVRDIPIGPVMLPLRFPRPAFVGVEDRAGSPTLEVVPARPAAPSGFEFRTTNETRGRLDPECYGSTTVSTAFVQAAAAGLPGAGPLVHHPGGAFDLYQDVFVLAKEG